MGQSSRSQGLHSLCSPPGPCPPGPAITAALLSGILLLPPSLSLFEWNRAAVQVWVGWQNGEHREPWKQGRGLEESLK